MSLRTFTSIQTNKRVVDGARPSFGASQRVRGPSIVPTQQRDAMSAFAWQAMRMASIIARCNPAPVVAEAPAPPALSDDEILAASIEIRVGKIVACELHPEADNLYVEQIDVGEEEPRTIVSGLVNFVPLEQMQGRKVVVICNLKGRNLKGIKSNGMVLCASDASHENVEVLSPPEEAPVGERVWFGEGNEKQEEAKTPNQLTKKKLWEQFQPDLKTNADKVAGYKGAAMLTSAGPVTTASLSSAGIS